MTRLIFSFLFIFSYSFLLGNSIQVSLPIKNLMENEIGQLHIISENELHVERGDKIQGNGFTLTFFASAQSGRDHFIYAYNIETSRTGDFRTPTMEVKTRNGSAKLPSAHFKVHPKSSFQRKAYEVDGKTFPYYSATFIDKKSIYINEAIEVEIRYLLPERSRLNEWGITDAEHSTEVIAWKPKPPSHGIGGYALSVSKININGVSHVGAAYKTNVYSSSQGSFTYGPVKSSVVLRKAERTVFGNALRNFRQELVSDSVRFDTKPLPSSAPKNFNGNVGAFQIKTELPKSRRITEQDSIKLRIEVSGEGNFMTLSPPILNVDDGWELIETIKSDLREAPRSTQNSVSYDLIISPQTKVTHTPEVSFVFFNPLMRQYQELTSTTANVTIVDNVLGGGLTSPPIENQKDILGFINTPNSSFTDKIKIPRYWHALPATILLAIIGIWISRKIKSHKLKNVDQTHRKQELKALGENELDYPEFLKKAGFYVEKYSNEKLPPELQEVIDERDEICFTPDSTKITGLHNKKEKILKVLSQLSLFILISVLFQDANANPLSSASQAIENENYQQALEDYKEVENKNAAVNYNMGVCYYKLNQLGLACLHFHKAVAKQEGHPEATQNLNFLSEKLMHPSQPKIKKVDKYLSAINRSTYSGIAQVSTWLIIILTAGFLLLQFNKLRKIIILSSITVSLVLLITSFVAYQAYPQSIYFAPIKSLAVITKPKQLLLTSPITPLSPSSESVITEVPEGSLCQILNKKADWYYVELPSATRGWVNANATEMIQEPDPNLPEPHLP